VTIYRHQNRSIHPAGINDMLFMPCGK